MYYIKLNEICDINIGKTPSRNNEQYWGVGANWLSISDIKHRNIFDTKEQITEKAISECNMRIVPKDTVVMSFKLSIGKVAILNEDMYTNEAIANFPIKNKEVILPQYLYYALRTLSFDNTDRAVMGNTLNKAKLNELVIPYCGFDIQQKIVEVLDKAQELIDKREAQIEALDELIKSKFIEMFGDPINNPNGWEVKKLRDISTKILSGNTPKGGSEVYVDEGIMFFRSQNVWKGRLVLDDIAYIDEKTHEKMKNSSLKNKDILMTKTGRINTENSSLGRAAMFLGEDDSANINGHVYLIRPQDGIIHEFVLFILTTNEYREYIRSVCVGGIDKRQINKEHLEEFPIIFPPIELQNQFANFVNQVDKLKFEMEESLRELENNFNSLMQKAFNGELFN